MSNYNLCTKLMLMLFLITSLIQGLKNLHDNRLVHVDVKLENILMTANGVCKLGDFGLLVDMSQVSHILLTFCPSLRSKIFANLHVF